MPLPPPRFHITARPPLAQGLQFAVVCTDGRAWHASWLGLLCRPNLRARRRAAFQVHAKCVPASLSYMLRCLHPQRPGLSLHPQRPVLILHPSFQACSTHKPRHTPTTRCGPNSVTCWAALPRLCSTSMTEILVFRSAYGWAYGAASPPCCWLQSVMSRLSPPTARLARTVVVGSNKTVVMR